jgi:MATE family multidrug resistance protein
VAFVGQYNGSIYIDASSYAVRLSNVVGISVGLGFASVLETLSTQSRGAGNARAVSFYLQQGIGLLSCVFVPVAIFLYNTEAVLVALGQPPAVAQLAGVYAVWVIPCVAITYAYELLRRALQAFGVLAAFTYAAFAGLLCQTFFTWLFVAHLDIGFLGSVYGRVLGQSLQLCVVIGYLHWTNAQRLFWDGWTVAALDVRRWWPWFQMGIPAVLQLGFEWWIFELYGLLTGYFADPELTIAAYSINLQVTSLFFMLYLGNATASGLRVGVLLGAGRGLQARFAMICGLVSATLIGGCGGLTMFVFRAQIVRVFIHDEAEPLVAAMARSALAMSATYAAFDSLHAVCAATFRAASMQTVAAVITFTSFWVVALPVGYALSINPGYVPGINGLVLSLLTALVVAVVLDFVVLFARLDWDGLGLDVSRTRRKEVVVVVADNEEADDSGDDESDLPEANESSVSVAESNAGSGSGSGGRDGRMSGGEIELPVMHGAQVATSTQQGVQLT